MGRQTFDSRNAKYYLEPKKILPLMTELHLHYATRKDKTKRRLDGIYYLDNLIQLNEEELIKIEGKAHIRSCIIGFITPTPNDALYFSIRVREGLIYSPENLYSIGEKFGRLASEEASPHTVNPPIPVNVLDRPLDLNSLEKALMEDSGYPRRLQSKLRNYLGQVKVKTYRGLLNHLLFEDCSIREVSEVHRGLLDYLRDKCLRI
jgi:hypothetical protein